ncbi:hypothetical protein [Streptomyces sp. NPDC048142]|uniref:hypothetical protein n=1 Tax=Streptomyces sp. NPDC048142 TaxID=3365501 RepID=UPI003719452F
MRPGAVDRDAAGTGTVQSSSGADPIQQLTAVRGSRDPDEAAAMLAEALAGDLEGDGPPTGPGVILSRLLAPHHALYGRFPAVPELRHLLDAGAPLRADPAPHAKPPTPGPRSFPQEPGAGRSPLGPAGAHGSSAAAHGQKKDGNDQDPDPRTAAHFSATLGRWLRVLHYPLGATRLEAGVLHEVVLDHQPFRFGLRPPARPVAALTARVLEQRHDSPTTDSTSCLDPRKD